MEKIEIDYGGKENVKYEEYSREMKPVYPDASRSRNSFTHLI